MNRNILCRLISPANWLISTTLGVIIRIIHPRFIVNIVALRFMEIIRYYISILERTIWRELTFLLLFVHPGLRIRKVNQRKVRIMSTRSKHILEPQSRITVGSGEATIIILPIFAIIHHPGLDCHHQMIIPIGGRNKMQFNSNILRTTRIIISTGLDKWIPMERMKSALLLLKEVRAIIHQLFLDSAILTDTRRPLHWFRVSFQRIRLTCSDPFERYSKGVRICYTQLIWEFHGETTTRPCTRIQKT